MSEGDGLEVTLVALQSVGSGEVKLTFAVQKDDVPKVAHLVGLIGHQFMMGLGRIDHQQEGPVVLDKWAAVAEDLPRPRNHYAQKAGILADELKFQLWISNRWPKQAQECGTADEFIRRWCGVKSRAEILPDTDAAGKFHRLVELYELP